ncbi:hypothetical protein SAMN05660462_02065 [Proteiniborus ethanoligenes]|uniref:Uncharacterized protein n=1 Tax=Proteiniborus ethanoligenes TaxID=415015 RepID=A0A1H3QSC4_9FIRM|nr:hypothetical protein [Proteiniborus ethanoligenes]TAH63216.1 MAG: hypothetical protein EWM50_03475 [Gottschalkiaceae bacterium]SDZ16240.1 hypothetical protein SAMN05660462_02065 [Proteiniborus ethanoligenes]
MKTFKYSNKDVDLLRDINSLDIIRLKEIGLSDEELANELRIPKAHLSNLCSEYDVETQGE